MISIGAAGTMQAPKQHAKTEAMVIVVEVKNEILGSGEFWRGSADRIGEIRNIPARRLAKLVCSDGEPRKSGMWHVYTLQS